MVVGWLVHCDALILLVYVTFTFTFRAFSRHFVQSDLSQERNHNISLSIENALKNRNNFQALV